MVRDKREGEEEERGLRGLILPSLIVMRTMTSAPLALAPSYPQSTLHHCTALLAMVHEPILLPVAALVL